MTTSLLSAIAAQFYINPLNLKAPMLVFCLLLM